MSKIIPDLFSSGRQSSDKIDKNKSFVSFQSVPPISMSSLFEIWLNRVSASFQSQRPSLEHSQVYPQQAAFSQPDDGPADDQALERFSLVSHRSAQNDPRKCRRPGRFYRTFSGQKIRQAISRGKY